jgi:hypothetical protein
LPLLELKMLTATVLSHHIVTNFEGKNWEKVRIATRIFIASQWAIQYSGLWHIASS